MLTIKFKSALILTLILIFIVTCKKDDNDKQNSFIVNETEYLTPNGYLEIYLPKVDGGYFGITLTDGEYLTDSSYYHNLNTMVNFDFKSPSTAELSSGEYVFDADWPPNSFDYGFVVMYGLSGVSFDITDGSVYIEKIGESYQISYDITIGSSTPLTGYYKGPLTEVDLTQ
jgi:hypothetical protein